MYVLIRKVFVDFLQCQLFLIEAVVRRCPVKKSVVKNIAKFRENACASVFL